MQKQKAKITDLENEIASKVFCYLCIEPHSVKQLASKIYGKEKENFRKGITDWIQKFGNAGWLELQTTFTKEKFYEIKLNPFYEWIENNKDLTAKEKEYLHFLIREFLIERLKKVNVFRDIWKVFSELLNDAKTIKYTYNMFGFDKRFDFVVHTAKSIERTGKFYIPDDLVELNRKMFDRIKVGKGFIDLTFIFASLLMPDSLLGKY